MFSPLLNFLHPGECSMKLVLVIEKKNHCSIWEQMPMWGPIIQGDRGKLGYLEIQ
jgi:hypothetical protein